MRTSRLSLRPWEMTCAVAGFPSNIAALQFEWAWQNAHLTRHVPQAQRLSFPTTYTKTSARTGKTRKTPGRPRTSLMDKLSNLHLLLRAPYFSQWPLEVRFFNQDAFRSWQSWCDRVDAEIRPGIRVHLDLPERTLPDVEITSAQPPPKRRKVDLIGKGGVEGIDPTYARFHDVLQKSMFLLDEGDGQSCAVCGTLLDVKADLFVLCPCQDCHSISHITCLATKFLEERGSASIIPEGGSCPTCHDHLRWADLMQEVTLRARGEKEIRKLLNKKGKSRAVTAAEILDTESEDEMDLTTEGLLSAPEVVDDGAVGDVDDTVSVASTSSYVSVATNSELWEDASAKTAKLEIVIEDSEDER